jgi:hypothetical protein
VPNTDDDTMIYRYKGYELQYASPKILAVLVSPPYFEDLKHLEGGDSYIGGGSTEFTSGQGSGSGYNTTQSVTAGAYVTFEHSLNFFGLFELEKAEIDVALAYNYTWDREHTTEISKAITYGNLQRPGQRGCLHHPLRHLYL